MTWRKIINIEYPKLLRMGNYILIALLLLAYIGFVFFVFYYFSRKEDEISISDLLNQFSSVETAIFKLFIVLFVIINIGKEFSDKTLKKNIIDGYSRNQFFTGKLLMLLIFSLSVIILGKIILMIGGLSIGQFQNVISYLSLPRIINPFINILYIGIFAFFLIFLTRNTIVSIIIYFVWGTIESISMVIQTLINNEANLSFYKYLPLSSINYVFSSTEIINNQSIFVTTLYVLLMLFIPYYLFLKRDIK